MILGAGLAELPCVRQAADQSSCCVWSARQIQDQPVRNYPIRPRRGRPGAPLIAGDRIRTGAERIRFNPRRSTGNTRYSRTCGFNSINPCGGRDDMVGWGAGSEWAQHSETRSTDMLWTIFVVLLLLWLVGIVSSYTLGGFIHILLLAALVVLIIRIIQGRSITA